MAPEQAESDGAIGPATDVWSFGLLAFFALAGRSFWGEDASPATQVKRLVVDPIPRASVRARELGAAARLPDGFDAWFARCVARAPGHRFASIAAANDELERLLGTVSLAHAATVPVTPDVSPPPEVAPARAAPVGGRGRRLAAVLGAAVAAVGLAAYAGSHRAPTGTGAPLPSAPGPLASASAAARFELDDEDHADHDTRWRVPLGDSPRTGGKEPLVTIVEFGDFECPYTRAFEDAAKQMLATYGDDVALVWKDVPLDLHPIAEPAARLARLARAEQGDDGFWRAHDMLFSVCAGNDGAALPAFGRALGLPAAKVRAAIDGPTPDAIERDIALAIDLNKIGVPGYFFNGRYAAGSRPFAKLRPLIEQEMATARRLVASGLPRAAVYDELQKGARASEPLDRHEVDIPDERLPTLAGAHAVLDVHQFGDETNFFVAFEQPVVDWMLREYGDRIRLHWHWLPDASNPTSMRIAAISHDVFDQNGNDVAWKFHALLVENAPWPFEWPGRRARGLGDDALLDYARQAGANQMYLANALKKPVDPTAWRASRETLEQLQRSDPGHSGTFLYAGGYTFGAHRRVAKRILDQLLSPK
jgi:protein-disulfide isomerase